MPAAGCAYALSAMVLISFATVNQLLLLRSHGLDLYNKFSDQQQIHYENDIYRISR
ncbi:hypothetical protein [Nostoc favosum]|uniref:Uncharacterized protein n=1 Tax=Nostoc favosum CHAB5714 TaxID=2780399 RepID=A0ABS8I242_9NOSO|nr:hypothetical protein [Nostoc favosum]MCC5598255.1 hypothetical protein [Nostoc favosum CHAB5714]